MRFDPLSIDGAYRLRSAVHEDDRGAFARVFCADSFRAQGLETDFVQRSISTNRRAGVLRGLHYQAAPQAEAKLVRCLRGAMFDVIVDLRAGSPTLHKVCAIELAGDGLDAVYIPAGCAHGFQTLVDDTQILYDITPGYAPEASLGVRWDDPDLAIEWPIADPFISDRDRALPLLRSLGLEL